MKKVKPGRYLYSRPGWDYFVVVEVNDIPDEGLMIEFKHDCHPVSWKNIPTDAIFESIIEGLLGERVMKNR